MRLTIVTNIPAPYRTPIFELIGQEPDVDLTLLYFAEREPDREWELQSASFRSVFLTPRFITWRGRYIHFTSGVARTLGLLNPDILITDGFNPAHLAAFRFARLHHIPHVAMTDGTFQSEQVFSAFHRLVRKYIYKRSSAFIGASDGSIALYRSYGVGVDKIFKSHLCCDVKGYRNSPDPEKRFDLIFSGRLIPAKSPHFALELARCVSRILGRRIRLLIVGSGPLQFDLEKTADSIRLEVETEFYGFATQQELPHLYRSAELFVFPTLADVWGVVANEACAAGLPVLITPMAGAANEIVVDGVNGYILPLDLDAWVTRAAELLSDTEKRSEMGSKSLELVAPYNYRNAAGGLLAAARAAIA